MFDPSSHPSLGIRVKEVRLVTDETAVVEFDIYHTTTKLNLALEFHVPSDQSFDRMIAEAQRQLALFASDLHMKADNLCRTPIAPS